MNRNIYESIKIKCPYVVRCGAMGDKSTIVCEGFYENSTQQLTFDSAKERKEYIVTHCASIEKNCKIAQHLDEEWAKEKGRS